MQGVLSSQGGAWGMLLSICVQLLWFVLSEMDLAALRWLLQPNLMLHSHVLIFLTSIIPISVHYWIILALVPAELGLARRCHLSFAKGLLCCDQSLLTLIFHKIDLRCS